jgi:hypothetical protein
VQSVDGETGDGDQDHNNQRNPPAFDDNHPSPSVSRQAELVSQPTR